MGKIPNWTPHHDDTPPYVEYRWVHDETGQILEVSNEKDGEWYDVDAWNRTRESTVSWESGYDNKERARNHATSILRRHEDGQLFDPTEWPTDDVNTIPLWKRETARIDLSVGGTVSINYCLNNDDEDE